MERTVPGMSELKIIIDDLNQCCLIEETATNALVAEFVKYDDAVTFIKMKDIKAHNKELEAWVGMARSEIEKFILCVESGDMWTLESLMRILNTTPVVAMDEIEKMRNIIKDAHRVQVLGLKEMEENDSMCIYPDCENCGECFFKEVERILGVGLGVE